MTPSDKPGASDRAAWIEQLFEAAPDCVIVLDDRGAIWLVNHQAELLFGYPRTELVGQPLGLLMPGDDQADSFARPTTRAMNHGLEVQGRRKDGSEFPAEVSLSSVTTTMGVLVSVSVRDLSDRRARETRLSHAHKLESMGQMAGGVAHDFNNLLAGIMNYVALVADGLEVQSKRLGLARDVAFTTLAEDLEEITKVANRAAGLTNQLLTLSRRQVTKPDIVDLNSIVTELSAKLRETLGANVEMQVVLAPEHPRIRAERSQIEQVLMNLALNARDAMPTGGTLRIATREFSLDEGQARRRSANPGKYAGLTVSDSGSGMPKEVARRALEPFFTTKHKGAGTGLGLAMVYGIATQTGGDVTIYSEEGLGTTVRVNFPATRELAAVESEAPPKERAPTRGATILLVDDEEVVREPTRRLLQRHGYTVLEASSADEALMVAHEHVGELNLLLTDVVMPGRSGSELVDMLLSIRPETAVLYMSGYSANVLVYQGVLAEGVRVIGKPFPPRDLLATVREILDAQVSI